MDRHNPELYPNGTLVLVTDEPRSQFTDRSLAGSLQKTYGHPIRRPQIDGVFLLSVYSTEIWSGDVQAILTQSKPNEPYDQWYTLPPLDTPSYDPYQGRRSLLV